MISEVVQILDQIRLEQRRSFEELAGDAAISTLTLMRWLCGQSQPSLDKLERALAALGYELEVVKLGEKKP